MDPREPPISSIATAFEVLDVLGELGVAGPTEVATVLDASKSTVHRHLESLVHVGVVQKDEDGYRLCMRLLEHGTIARDQYAFYSVAKPVVDDLVQQTNEAAAIAVMEEDLIYIYESWSQQRVTVDLELGRAYQDYHCSAAGKALLASMPEQHVHEILDTHGLPQRTPNTIVDRDALFEELATIRAQGTAFDDEEWFDGVRSVATTLEDRETGETLGAITVYGPAIRLNGEVFTEEVPTVLERAASLIELSLRYE